MPPKKVAPAVISSDEDGAPPSRAASAPSRKRKQSPVASNGPSKRSTNDVTKLKAENQRLREYIEQQDGQYNRLVQIRSTEAEEQLENLKTAAEERRQGAEKQLHAYKSEVEQLKKELKEAVALQKSVVESTASPSGKADVRVAQLQAENERLREQVAQGSSRSGTDGEIKRLKSRIGELEKTNAEASSRCASQDALNLTRADSALQREFDTETALSKSLQAKLKSRSGDVEIVDASAASQTFDAEAARVLQLLTGLSFVRRQDNPREGVDWKMDFLLADLRKSTNDQPRLSLQFSLALDEEGGITVEPRLDHKNDTMVIERLQRRLDKAFTGLMRLTSSTEAQLFVYYRKITSALF